MVTWRGSLWKVCPVGVGGRGRAVGQRGGRSVGRLFGGCAGEWVGRRGDGGSVQLRDTAHTQVVLRGRKGCEGSIFVARCCSADGGWCTRGGEIFGRGGLRRKNFTVKKSGEIPPPPAKFSRCVTNIFTASSFGHPLSSKRSIYCSCDSHWGMQFRAVSFGETIQSPPGNVRKHPEPTRK